uniref:Uncharacterized protein n=1 Tax=Chenopodium quinoa TaxID=63459 RepID=A0A803M6L3_CHEQI
MLALLKNLNLRGRASGGLGLRPGHSKEKCRIKREVAKRRLKSRVASLERQGLRVLYGPRECKYYSNLVKGLPNRERYRNPEANLVCLEEPEDMPLEDRNLVGDGDSDSGLEIQVVVGRRIIIQAPIASLTPPIRAVVPSLVLQVHQERDLVWVETHMLNFFRLRNLLNMLLLFCLSSLRQW